MELRRTANAGFLLKLDGVMIALDGVCLEVPPYQAAPPAERDRLLAAPPDLLAFTHDHADHFDPNFASEFQKRTLRPILGTDQVARALPGCRVSEDGLRIRNVRITPVTTRHIGKSCLTTNHVSFIIEGSKCIWFAGDATPTQLGGITGFPKADILIAPYAYVTTGVALHTLQVLQPKHLVLTHMPLRSHDPHGLWAAVDAMLPKISIPVSIPGISETLSDPFF